MKSRQHDRLEMIQALHRRFTRGGRTARWRSRFKAWFWRATVASAYILKRVIDIVGSLCGLILLSPVLALTAFCIKREDGGPIFYKQTRVGKHGSPFSMFKFRSMVVNADAIRQTLTSDPGADGVRFKMQHDPRITKTGRIIRKLSIDELPQLANVLFGDMSLVGPRPPIPSETALYTPDERRRLDVKPGITCLWQISGRSELSFSQQVELDKAYIESQSLWTDIVILLKTIPAVISGKGAY
ncbi:sugar transferase [Desulfovibrio inopinatus]|uniref:sugar transferase n=1 Tax=Desulfovibrio inopinatus TaxID=102109 RepID=UPI0003F6D5C7|nr:sugar transferase [Desulfovibrio inopinatus]